MRYKAGNLGMEKSGKRNYLFFILGLLTFIGFDLDIVVCRMVSYCAKQSIDQFDFFQKAISLVIVWIVWGIWAYGMFQLSRNKLDFNPFEFKGKPSVKGLAVCLFLLIFISAVLFYGWNCRFKPEAEYQMQLQKYGAGGFVTFIFQYMYYAFETALIILTMAFGQQFGERLWKHPNVPWGGIFLGITWGINHALTKELAVGLFSLFASILYGIVYILVKKNVRYAYPIVYLMFVL